LIKREKKVSFLQTQRRGGGHSRKIENDLPPSEKEITINKEEHSLKAFTQERRKEKESGRKKRDY